MSTEKKTPAQIRFPAPKRLAQWLARAGFDVELVISRAEKATVDPDAELPPVDAPFSAEDAKNLTGILGGYEAVDHDDTGPKFSPPK